VRSIALFAIVFLSFPSAPGSSGLTAQTPGSVITGRVVDEDQHPLIQAQVSLENSSIGTLTDDAGRFRLTNVPPGRVRIQAVIIGHARGAAILEVQEGDSIEVVLELAPVKIYIPGSTIPLPGPEDISGATALLQTLLTDSIFLSSLHGNWPDVGTGDTIPVWTAWYDGKESPIIGRAPSLRVQKNCAECVGRSAATVEGGAAYFGKARHVNVGLRSDLRGIDGPTFCLAFVEGEDFLLKNCGGLGNRSRAVNFGQDADGNWVLLGWW
jgi:hypothetical protein